MYSPKRFKSVRSLEHLPPSPTHITFDYYFNSSITSPFLRHSFNSFKSFQSTHYLPPSIPHSFNTSKQITLLSLLYSSSLTHLSLGHCFNQPIVTLPPSMSHLQPHVLESFNPTLFLPSSITHLTLRTHFNQYIDRLPPSITHITIRDDFDHSINILLLQSHISLLPPSTNL